MIHGIRVLAAMFLISSVWAQTNTSQSAYMLGDSENTVWRAQPPAPASECSRASLQSAVDSYLEALESANPSRMSLTPQVKYIENQKESAIGQGILQQPLKIDFYRSVFDVDTCQSFSEVIVANSAHPYVLGTRLELEEGKIAQIESIVTDEGDWLFNAANYLKYSKQEKWDILPRARRSDRQTLIRAADAYFDVFSDRSSVVPWGIPCARLEGGAYSNARQDPQAACNSGAPLSGGNVPITERHYLVDEDMGTVVGIVRFGSHGWPDSHMFRLENGKLRYVHTLTVCGLPNCGLKPTPPSTPQK